MIANDPTGPAVVPFNCENVPAELIARKQWVLWRLLPDGADKWRKLPVQADGRAAASNNSATWTTFASACAAFDRGDFAGVGFVFTSDDPFVGVDLDDCRDAATGAVEPWALELLAEIGPTYCEVSPSGTGLKLWAIGTLPTDRTGAKRAYQTGAVEMYQCGRFFCVTGARYGESPLDVNEASEAIANIWHRIVKPAREQDESAPSGPRLPIATGNDVMDQARRYVGTIPGAVSGQSGHDATYRVACVLLEGFGLSTGDALQLLGEWNATCKPPWSATELRHKVESADENIIGPRGKLLRESSDGSNGRRIDSREHRDAEPTDKPPKKSTATALVELALGGAELWRDPAGEAWATIRVDGHAEHWPAKSRTFKRWLQRIYYGRTGKSANNQAVGDALGVIEAQAVFAGDVFPTAVRVAQSGDAIYVDLCDPGWRAVEIESTGWRVVENPPVKFRRAKAMLSLPEPTRGGTIDALRPFVNVADDDWALVKAWLVGALRPTGPYPFLCLSAEQGSGKSTTARVLRSLLDPNTAPLRSEPREPRDLMIAATNGWVVSLDNLSRVAAWLSDALCRISTGGGFSTRMLYENDEEIIFDATRPTILNGIEEVATRGDLLDRALMVSLRTIPESDRRAEAELLAQFERLRPSILGALLDAVATATANVATTRLDRLPRMADFALWATAAEPALGMEPGQFLESYSSNRAEANSLALEASPLAKVLMELLADAGEIEGAPTAVLERLNRAAGIEGKAKPPEGWPANGRALSGHLKRIAPNLRRLGVEVSMHRAHGGNRQRVLKIESREICVPTVPTVPNAEKNSLDLGTQNPARDANRDANPTLENGEKPLHGTQRDARDAKIHSSYNGQFTPRKDCINPLF